MSPTESRNNLLDIVGWSSAIILPALLLLLLKHTSLNWACVNFIVIFLAALIMWIFRLVPEYAPAVFVILSTMLLGLAPQSVLLSGFESDSFFMALSVFGIGAVVVKSRLFYRLSLLTLNHLPKHRMLLQFVIFSIGALMTPVMTAQSSRVSLISHLVEDMRKTAGFKPYSVAANGLACAAFNGSILLSVIFLTGKSSNFVLYGMLSEQAQWQYGWLNWFLAAAVPGLVLVCAFFIMMAWTFRNNEPIHINLHTIRRELFQLGALSIDEWAAIISIVALLVGLISSSWHQIPSAWISFSIFFVLLTSGILNKKDFKNGINWPFLFYLGTIIGIMRCVQEIGIDSWIIEGFSWLTDIADDQLVWFIVLIYILSWLGGFLFGTMAAPALLFTVFLPIAQHSFLNTWMVAFIILMATEAWAFPYQSSYFLCYEESLAAHKAYKLRPTLMINFWFIFLRLAAILISIPLWYLMGVL
jgi:DASS family divalent anion:Na+ symporter